MYQTEESIGQFSIKFHGSRWNIFLIVDEHRNGPLRNGVNLRLIFFHINSHILQNAPPKFAKVFLGCDYSGYAIIK